VSWRVALQASFNFKRDNLFFLVNIFLLVNGMVGLFVEINTKQCGSIISLSLRKRNKASAYLLNTCVLLHENYFKMTAQMSTCDYVIGLHSSSQKKKSNIPTLGPRLLVKFLRVEKAIKVKCPTYAQGPPRGLTVKMHTNTLGA